MYRLAIHDITYLERNVIVLGINSVNLRHIVKVFDTDLKTTSPQKLTFEVRLSQDPYHWYQSRPSPVLHHDSEKDSTARKRWKADKEALGDLLPKSIKKARRAEKKW